MLEFKSVSVSEEECGGEYFYQILKPIFSHSYILKYSHFQTMKSEIFAILIISYSVQCYKVVSVLDEIHPRNAF